MQLFAQECLMCSVGWVKLHVLGPATVARRSVDDTLNSPSIPADNDDGRTQRPKVLRKQTIIIGERQLSFQMDRLPPSACA